MPLTRGVASSGMTWTKFSFTSLKILGWTKSKKTCNLTWTNTSDLQLHDDLIPSHQAKN